ncbi:MAG: hypothetical protein ABSG96_05350 [Terracidiphilus sp.]|jgi:hypothetical protein
MSTSSGKAMKLFFELDVPAGGVALRENYGFARRELVTIERCLIQNLAALLRAWERIHGAA